MKEYCQEEKWMTLPTRTWSPKKSFNTLVQPPKFPTATLPTKLNQENSKFHTNLRKFGQQEKLERGHPLAKANEKLQTHTSPFLASDCQTDSASRPSLCLQQPGQPMTEDIKLSLAKPSLFGTVIGGRQEASPEKTREPMFWNWNCYRLLLTLNMFFTF